MAFSSKNPYRKKRSAGKTTPVTIGTHVTSGMNTRKNPSSQEPAYARSRKTSRAKRGEVDHVILKTRSGESASDHAKRVNKEHYTKNLQRKSTFKGIIVGVISLLLIAAVAFGVGGFAYASSVSEKMALSDGSTKDFLIPAEDDKAEYLLLVAEFSEAGKQYDGPSLITLVRLDKEAKQVTLLSIPPNFYVTLDNGEYGRLREVQLSGGDGALIAKINELTGISVSHLIKTNKEDFVELVDYFDGLTVEISEEVDDPMAGSIYIPEGTQTLTGEAALTLCRATNLTGGISARAENQNKVALALAEKVLASGDVSLLFTLDGIADKIETDLGANDAIDLITAFKGISPENIFMASMPGYSVESESTGVTFFYSDDTNWTYMLTAFKEGQAPEEALPQEIEVDPASFEIIVRNGSGITGGASQVADSLAAGGFVIKETGNADRYVYEETLVVYQDSAYAAAAESVVSYLDTGRVVASNGFYTFDAPILVVVGKDWKPLN